MKKQILTVLSTGLVTSGILISTPFLVTSCSRDKPNPLPPTLSEYNWDGTNWSGWLSGSLTLIDLGNHQAEIQTNNTYIANNLVIPDEVINDGVIYKLISIGINAFQNCIGLTGSLTIGNNVTSIGDRAFYNCSGFTGSLIIPNSVTSIGISAFDTCSGFTDNLTIGNSVTSIGDGAFQECTHLTGNLTIGNSVTSIGNGAFYNCSGLTGSLTIPNSVTTIGGYVFYDCTNFTGSLTIPNSVTSIGTLVFRYCNGFTSLNFDNFQSDPSWSEVSIFSGLNSSGGTVAVTGNYTSTWTSSNALAYAISKGLNSSWHN